MRVNSTFGKRSKTEIERTPKVKYFIAFEGSETESQYFSGVEEFKKELGIDKLFSIVPLLRHSDEVTWSHPCKFIKPLIRTLNEFNSGQMSIESVVKHSVDHFFECDPISDVEICRPQTMIALILETLQNSGYQKDDPIKNDAAVLKLICDSLYAACPDEYTDKSISGLQEYLENQVFYYDPELDKVCLIVDRDPGNFKPEQYDALLSVCKKHRFSLYVSNPCFEFWLMLHFQKILELDRGLMLENRKITGCKRYLDGELRKELKGYKKNNIHFENLKDNIDVAIINEHQFCEDELGLKTELGSNVGRLMSELKGN